MVQCGIRPNQYTLSTVINCFCHLNQMGFGLSVLGHFFKLGLRPDVVAYNTLINGFVLKNRIQEAAGIFSKMLQGGHCVPSVLTFSTIIKGLCRRGDNNAAIQLLRKMDERGCEANLVIYSTIIDGLCKDTLVVDAMNLFSEMISRGIAPNVVTYTSLIQGVCDIGQWQEATRLLNEMASINIYPNIVTYNVLVDGLCKVGKVVEANSVVEIMILKDIEPDVVTYSSLMDGYCLRGEMGDARKVFDLMLRKGRMVAWWMFVVTYAILLDGLCSSQQLSRAMELLREMEDNKLELDIIIYTSVVERMCKAGRLKSCSTSSGYDRVDSTKVRHFDTVVINTAMSTCVFINPSIPEIDEYKARFNKPYHAPKILTAPAGQWKEGQECYIYLQSKDYRIYHSRGMILPGLPHLQQNSKLELRLEDEDDSTTAIIIGKAADNLFGVTCEELVNEQGEDDKHNILLAIQKVKNKYRVWWIDYGIRDDFLVKDVYPQSEDDEQMAIENTTPQVQTPAKRAMQPRNSKEATLEELLNIEMKKKQKR
ncbi:hypothetical protein ACLB2K_027190 [Fragaria x ananassa]